MEYVSLTQQGEHQSGDWVSLKIGSDGSTRTGMITEFENDGFWIRFEDDFDYEDFIGYDESYWIALVRRPVDVKSTYASLAEYPALAAELQDRVIQGFEILEEEAGEGEIRFYIRLLDAGNEYTQTL
ncbi:MAG: hypothetical protein ACRC00_07220, partial [Exiguobacterium acetylicum]